jgi:prepilin-type N-terminal cleavage/methylation domain-containing protein
MRGFTLLELLITVAVIGIASSITLITFLNFRRDSQLRHAAVALAGYLDVAKTVAKGAAAACQLSITATPATVAPGTTPGSCASQPSLNLNDEAGATGITASGSTLITFTSRGFVSTETITYLTIPNSSIQACVRVNSPAGLIHKGFRQSSSTGACNYVDWY